MRTKHLLMAIATLLVAGCSQNEKLRRSEQSVIQLSDSMSTRGWRPEAQMFLPQLCKEHVTRPIMAVSALWDITQGVKIGMRLKEP